MKYLLKVILTSILFICPSLLSADNTTEKNPKIYSPEDLSYEICIGSNGASYMPSAKCGCDFEDGCGVCGGDDSSCCLLVDCEGKAIADSGKYCKLDIDGNKTINHQDLQLVKEFLNSRQDGTTLNDQNKKLDVNGDQLITPMDSLTIINFLNDNNLGSQPDECGICNGPGRNICGSCPSDANVIVPEGPSGICGCPDSPKYKGPYLNQCNICSNLPLDACGRCPGTDEYNTPCGCPDGAMGCDGVCHSNKTVDSCGVCDGEGPDRCGRCPDEYGYKFPTEACGCDFSKYDKGCGCGRPGPGRCGCNPAMADRGCGCGKPAPGICGCDATRAPGCDGVCGSGKIVDDCGVCGGDGSRCKSTCKYIVVRDMLSQESRGTLFSSPNNSLLKLPLCIQQILNRFELGDNKVAAYADADTERKKWRAKAENRLSAYLVSQNFFGIMDQNCNKVDVSRANYPTTEAYLKDICEMEFRTTGCPISLVLDKNYDVDKFGKVIQFKLNPHVSEKYIVWKGSEKTPLLVFDPTRSGKIVDGSQLFGDWTFGGSNPLASISHESNVHNPAWKNGFEALRTLDKNHDGILDGDELASLSLWFDKNRNAISEEGEVTPLSETGIKNLDIRGEQIKNYRGDIIVKNGFNREFNGKIESGKMVDWYTSSYSTAEEAITLEANNIFSRAENSLRWKSKLEAANPEIAPLITIQDPDTLKQLSSENFSGIWAWGIASDVPEYLKNSNKTGLITISDTEKEVKGHVYMEIAFEHLDSKKTYRSIIAKKFVAEKFIRDNKVGLKFVIKDNKGENTTEAFMSDENDLLIGHTTYKFTPENGPLNTINYDWLGQMVTK